MNESRAKISYVIYLLGLVSLLNDTSSEVIMSVLPFYLASLGGTPIAIGFIGGLEESARSFISYFAGKLSDKVKKRLLFVSLGYSISSISKLILYFAGTWISVLILRVIDRVGKAIRNPARDAMIASISTKDNLGITFGIHRAMDTSGAILGSLLALIIYWIFNLKLSHIILMAAFISFISFIPLLWVKEKKESSEHISKDNSSSAWSLPFLISIMPIIIYSLANFTYMFFLLKVSREYTEKLAIGIPLLMYLIFNVIYSIFSIPSGYLSDKIGKRKIIGIGYFIYAICCLGFITFSSRNWFILLFCLYGLAFAIVEGNQRAYISQISAKEKYGSSLGIYYMTTGFSTLLGSVIAGFLWSYNSAFPFLYGTILALAAGIMILLINTKVSS